MARLSSNEKIVRKHFLYGWWGIAVYMALGIALETMHGFKLAYYLNVENETRRFMWTLAHSHGTLLSLMNVAFSATVLLVQRGVSDSASVPARASKMIVAGWLLMPVGFFLGGVQFYGGDPGFGVLLVPVGALLLVVGVVIFCRWLSSVFKETSNSSDRAQDEKALPKRRKKGPRK